MRLDPSTMLRRIGEHLGRPAPAMTALLVARLGPAERTMLSVPGLQARQILAEVDQRIRGMLRAGDCYACASREEIWVLLPGLPADALARMAAHSLQERLRRPVEIRFPDGETRRLRLEPWVGGAWAPADAGVSGLSLLAAACEAASRPEASDEPPVRRHGATAAGSLSSVDHAEREIRAALEQNMLELRFQPQVDLRSNRCHAAEALIRWPERHALSIDAGTLVGICEQRGLIGQLTRFTLHGVLRNMAAWRRRGLDATIGINLSAISLSDPALPSMVSQALDTWGVPADRLTLELTESALVQDLDAARAGMRALHALGCRLSIDDFGTGHSPFTYLRSFPLDELKIDRSFVKPIMHESADRRIVTALIELAHAFGLQIVAEGVEDQPTQDYLRALGCDLAQGWNVSVALPPDEFARWCLRRNAGLHDDRPPASPPGAGEAVYNPGSPRGALQRVPESSGSARLEVVSSRNGAR